MSRTSVLTASAVLTLAQLGWANTPFTIVALPDTQNYVNNASNAPLFTQQTQWIADQVTTAGNPRNIQFVSHLGDIVSEGNDLTQWSRASASMGVLDNINLPYGILPGNHDYNTTSNKSTGTANYVANFGPSRFAGRSWYGGADPSGNNSFQRFTAGGYSFIHLSLEWLPTVNTPLRNPSPIQWAQSVIDAHPNTPFILSTHENLDDNPPGRSSGGEAMWQQLVRRNDAIFMVLNGHYHSASVPTNDGEYHQVSTNDAGRPVFEVLQDYQDYPRGGDGWLRLLNFDIPNNKIKVETYSPVLNQFQTETVAQVGQFASQFEFDVDFASRFNPIVLPPPPPPPTPDFSFQEGVNGYIGTQDTMVRSNETGTGAGQTTAGDSRDRSFGTLDFISVDGDDGSPGLKPNQGLIRFDNIVGTGPGQIPTDAPIASARLVLEVIDPGSGFTVHNMLVNWDENSTWNSLVNGVQTDGTEAGSAVLAAFGADNSGANVGIGTLSIDVTSTVQAYLAGTLPNLGWLLNPFLNGTNGVDIRTSEFGDVTIRPRLEVFLVPEPSVLALGAIAAGLLSRRRR